MMHHLRIKQLLNALYGVEQGEAAYTRLAPLLVAAAARSRPPTPRPTAERLTADDVLLITYGDQVNEPDKPPLQTLAEVLATILGGVVSGVHLLPFYPYTSDDGFSVVDYLTVNPALGTWADVERLGTHYRLMFDAVVNHISAGSAWFQDFLAGVPGAETRFILVDPATDLHGVTRPRTTPVLTPFETPTGTHHVWTTFSTDQIDLNYGSPDLLLEMTGVLLDYVAHGAGLIRLDAIGYLWKEPGTRCMHLPQAHWVVQLWRAVLDAVAPDVLLITETNVPHADNISYFGDGTNEAQLVYQFPLAPLVLHAFATGDARRLSGWAYDLASPTDQTAFFNFLASHDGIGVVPATGILTPDEVADLCAQVERHGGRVSYKTDPDGAQSPYELNCTWFDALSNPYDDEPVERKIDRFIASQAIMLALQGVPGIYIHSLFGSHNDRAGLDRTGRFRSMNREKWARAELETRLTDQRYHEGAVFPRLAALIRARRGAPAFHPNGPQRVLDLGAALFALERRSPAGDQTILCLHSASGEPQHAQLSLAANVQAVDLVGGGEYTADATGALNLELAPYQVVWLVGASVYN